MQPLSSSLRPALTFALLCTSLAAGAADADNSPGQQGMLGFDAQGAQHEHALEQRFDAVLDAKDQRAWLKNMSSQPNQVGSPHDKANAEFTRDQFRKWGWNADIETFKVLYPTPEKVALELVAPDHFTATLHEPPVAGDRTSSIQKNALPPYNVYGADGDVTAGLVYVNYGMPDDYKQLARRGISVKGKIAITRYGGGWRGLKPKLAQEHGAVGCLIYSDPADDGYGAGDTYPKGGWRPPEGVQRGSVADMQIYPGDPLTPGIGATSDAKRLDIKNARSILKIPVLPISYADAKPLLTALAGPVVPKNWRGGLPITYHIGPGPAEVHLTVRSDWSLKTIYDVIARIPGSSFPDEWVVRGNHRDGWMFGAWDPLAGNVAMLDEAKAIGKLVKSGWKPGRTLVYASWDAEEPGLIGSTEWAETHADELRKKAVVYINSDTNARGFLFVGGSHALQHLVNQVAGDVQDPETDVSVRQRLRARAEVRGSRGNADPDAKRLAGIAAKGGDLPIEALGSGSDYSPFLQHLGLASINLGYGGEDQQGGVYHSRYDSFDHFVKFGDPDFAYGVALSKTAGHIVLRMADASVLPMRFGDLADNLSHYIDTLAKKIKQERKQARTRTHLLASKSYRLAADPGERRVAPEAQSEVPDIDLQPLKDAVADLNKSAKAYQAVYDKAAAEGFAGTDAAHLTRVNQILQGLEQAFTNDKGLPGRTWYRHMIYAPGLLTGYGVKTLPGVREAIEARNWDQARQYIGPTATAIHNYSTQLDKATAALRG